MIKLALFVAAAVILAGAGAMEVGWWHVEHPHPFGLGLFAGAAVCLAVAPWHAFDRRHR